MKNEMKLLPKCKEIWISGMGTTHVAQKLENGKYGIKSYKVPEKVILDMLQKGDWELFKEERIVL